MRILTRLVVSLLLWGIVVLREMIISQRKEELIATDSFAEMTDTRVERALFVHLMNLRGASIDLLKMYYPGHPFSTSLTHQQ